MEHRQIGRPDFLSDPEDYLHRIHPRIPRFTIGVSAKWTPNLCGSCSGVVISAPCLGSHCRDIKVYNACSSVL